MIKSTSKRGRKTAVYYPVSGGNPVIGLMRLGDGRWRASGQEKYTYSERDEALAIAHFFAWQTKKTGTNLGTPKAYDKHSSAFSDAFRRAKTEGVVAEVTPPHSAGPFITTDNTLSPAQWAWLRRQIIDRPKWVAQQSGVETIGYLNEAKEPLPSPTLVEVGKLYFDHAKISENWMAKSKQFWREFTDSTKAETLRDITQENVIDYADAVKKQGETATYARQRFGAIKAMINFPPKRGKWAEDAKRALAFCAVLVKPKKSTLDPKPISVSDFATLLKAAKAEMKAMLLMAMNACMYGGEVAALDWSNVDLEKGTLSTDRNKTKVVRIAVLWPETIAALKALPRKRGVDAMFLTEAGTQASYLIVNRAFKAFRKLVNLPDVQFSQIRDGGYTAAVEAGIDLNVCKLLAGHQTGISDAYVKRRPKMVAGACEAIRVEYKIGSVAV